MPSAFGRHSFAEARGSNRRWAALLWSALAAHSVTIVTSLGGCAGRAAPQAVGGSTARTESLPAAESPSFVADALWQEARNGTEIEWQRLANREGAVGLVSVARLETEWSAVALRCLPLAEDALVALDFLCDATRNESGDHRRAVLEALHAIVAEPPRDTEDLTADAVPNCRERLASVLERGDLPPAERDLATSALRMLDERVRHR